jgi:hypothetical protein
MAAIFASTRGDAIGLGQVPIEKIGFYGDVFLDQEDVGRARLVAVSDTLQDIPAPRRCDNVRRSLEEIGLR